MKDGAPPHRRTRFLRQGSRTWERTTSPTWRSGRSPDMQQSYFELLNLEPRFGIVAEQLDQAYRALASRVHPDRYAQADISAQRTALQLATDANEAYRTLKKPVLRARHLLGLRGVATSERSISMPPEFLMEQMEWREALGDAQSAHDRDGLLKLGSIVRSRIAHLQQCLATLLDTEQNNHAAADATHQLMFVEKLLNDIDDACAALED
ncbi:MAG: Fe-S protein assembly co-chaperone HscB [Steroidobacteraceae bacterium]